MTPQVETIWNFWPLPIFVWTILRVPLNILFGIIYILTFVPMYIWNFLPEQIGFWFGGSLITSFVSVTFALNLGLVFFTFGLGLIPALIFGAIELLLALLADIFRGQITTVPS